MLNNNKILLISNIPTPYRVPLLNHLNTLFRDHGYHFFVLFSSRSSDRRKWKIDSSDMHFDHSFLMDNLKNGTYSSIFGYKNLTKFIKNTQPAVCITNGFSVATLYLWFLSLYKPIKYIIWSGDILTKGRKVNFLRTFYRKIITRRASTYIAYGTMAKKYLKSLGAKPEKIFIGINTVETEYFATSTSTYKSNKSKDNIKRILFIGYLTNGKRLDLMLKAFSELLKVRNDIIFDIVGDGPHKSILLELTNNLRINDNVVFHGYQQRENLPQFLSSADCFVFPSEYDIWGLVLNESMAAGVPCISSIHAGATHDLINDGENGFAVDFSDIQNVVSKICILFQDEVLAKSISINAQNTIQRRASIPKSAAGFLDAVESLNS